MQEYVENAKKTITSATRKVIKKSSEMYEVTKLSLKISALKGDIEEKYKEIGEIAYKSYKGDEITSESAEELFAKIDEINSKIDEYSKKLAAAKNNAVCPYCGAELSKDSTYCASCGEKI